MYPSVALGTKLLGRDIMLHAHKKGNRNTLSVVHIDRWTESRSEEGKADRRKGRLPKEDSVALATGSFDWQLATSNIDWQVTAGSKLPIYNDQTNI